MVDRRRTGFSGTFEVKMLIVNSLENHARARVQMPSRIEGNGNVLFCDWPISEVWQFLGLWLGTPSKKMLSLCTNVGVRSKANRWYYWERSQLKPQKIKEWTSYASFQVSHWYVSLKIIAIRGNLNVMSFLRAIQWNIPKNAKINVLPVWVAENPPGTRKLKVWRMNFFLKPKIVNFEPN